MKISRITTVTDEIMDAFTILIPQLSIDSSVPTKIELETIVNSDDTIIFIAKEERILGTLTLVFTRIPTGVKAWIEDVVVDTQAQGKGVGKELLKHAINHAIKRGAKNINLTSKPERVTANKLYQSLGFVKRETNVYRWLG